MGERETRDTGATARSQSVVHFTERDHEVAASLLASLLDRAVSSDAGPAVLVVLPALDDALALSEALRGNRRSGDHALTPITSSLRGRRLLAGGAAAIAGAPSELAKLISESKLSLAGLSTLVLVWPEETLSDEAQLQALESVIAEVPRSAERLAICSVRSSELTAFLERSMWRARTVDHSTSAAPDAELTLRVVSAVPSERSRSLRTLLDAYDPESAVLITSTDAGEAAALDAAAVLGSAGLIHVQRGVPERRFSLGVIFDDVPSAEDLAIIATMTDDLVALVRPSRLARLKKLATITPVTWSGALANARSAHDALRDEIRGTTQGGSHLSWVPIVEPLLEGTDAVEVAAAALMLLDRERRKAKKAATVQPAVQQPAERPVRDERPRGFGDRPAGGRSERGERPERGARFERGDRGGRFERGDRGGKFERGERRERDFTRKPFSRGGERDEGPRRGPPRDREDRPRREGFGGRRESFGARREGRGGDERGREERGPRRPPRGEDIERFPRAAREGREWAERGERLRHSRRGPRRGEGNE